MAWQLGQKHKTNIYDPGQEPPTWPSDSDEFMGLESMSEPDDMGLDDQQEDGGVDEPFFDAQHDTGARLPLLPRIRVSREAQRAPSSIQEDPMGPITSWGAWG